MDAKPTPYAIRYSLFGLLGFVIAVIGSPSAGQAATYYVDKSGSNSNSCAQALNATSPRQTMNAGISCLSAGDTLIVRAGTYNETFSNPFSNTGNSWANKTTVKAESPRSVIIRPSSGSIVMSFQNASQKYIEFDGIEIDAINSSLYGVRIWGAAHHIRFKNFAIFNAGDQGVSILKDAGASPDFNEFINGEVAYIAWDATTNQKKPCYASGSSSDGKCHPFYIGGDNNLIDGVNMHHSNGLGLQFFPFGNRGNTIRNSWVHDNWRGGIVSWGDNNKVANNVVWNNPGIVGLDIAESNNLVYNNTVYNNAGDGLLLSGSGHSVKNNIFYQNAPNVSLDPTNLVGTNPQFVDEANGNFRLKAGSPAIDRGVSLPEITMAIDGSPRPVGPAPDIGAYEFGGAGADTTPPAAPGGLRVSN